MKNALLYPRFLQKFDLYLVKKYPLIWSIRAHYFLYYSLLSFIVLGGLAMITPIDMTDLGERSHAVSISISSILAVTVACFWVYKTVIFDKQRQFGKRKITDEYISFILSYITLVGMWCIIFSYAGVLEFKRKNIVSDKELIEDINTANLAQMFMLETGPDNRSYSPPPSPRDFDEETPREFPAVSGQNHDTNVIRDYTLNSNYDFFTNYNLIKNRHSYRRKAEYEENENTVKLIDGVDEAETIKDRALKVKSKSEVYTLLQKIADMASKYEIYSIDKSSYRYADYGSSDRITFKDLKNQFDENIKQPKKFINKDEYLYDGNTERKYEVEPQTDLVEPKALNREIVKEITSFKHLLNSRLTDISYLKYSRRGFFGNDSLMISGYFLLSLCILLHIFKNVRWKQFVIYIVVACLLPIIYAVFGIILTHGSGIDSYVKICYYGTFFYGVVHLVLAYDRKEYSLWNIIGLMIFNSMILTLPLFTFMFAEMNYNHGYENYDEMVAIIQLAETAFYVIVILPMMKRIYERIYALPRN